MSNLINSTSSRRSFLTKAVPACALTCVFGKDMFGMMKAVYPQDKPKDQHMFDEEMDRKLTYRQFMGARYRDSMNLMKALEGEWGKEKTIEFLKNITTKRSTEIGKAQAERSPDTSLNTYVEQFRDGYKNVLQKEIVEDSEKAFELKVTECIWASTFRDANMGDYGYAWVCWGDYSWAQGFNPKIKMVRDKTLMQGDNCCNHRYEWHG